MNKAVIVYGPQGCGKTSHGELLRAHFGLYYVEDLPHTSRQKFMENNRVKLRDGVLYLTDLTRTEMIDKGMIETEARRVFAFDEAMEQISPERREAFAANRGKVAGSWQADVPRDKQKLRVKRLHPDAIVPKYQTAGAAAFDLHSIESGHINGARTFSTGLAYEVPEGYVMLIYSRSGQGFKHDVRLANCTGVIDSDYRGEMFVRLTEDAGAAPAVEKGDRIAQALLVKIDQWDIVEVDELSSTERGDGRFGSTGR